MAIEDPGTLKSHPRLLAVPDDPEEFAAFSRTAIAQLQPYPSLADGIAAKVRAHLEMLLGSSHFDASTRSREFLRYVVGEVLSGRGSYLKQTTIAMEVFGRRPDFDAIVDPIVRVQAGRLRRSLERYYLLSGDCGPIRIELPKGGYAPVFVETATSPTEAAAAPRRMEHARHWPLVAIHPFQVHVAGIDNYAVQIAEEVAAELCRYGIVRVTRPADAASRQPLLPAVRFELRGVADIVNDDALFAARLVDRTTGQQVWAEEFLVAPSTERRSQGAYEIGRVIAARIGAENGLIARLLAGEYAARDFEPHDDFSAIARFQHFLCSRQAGAVVPAVEALQQLTTRAPEVELAWTALGRLYLLNHTLELSSMFTPVEMAIGCANQSVRLEPASSRTRCLMATALLVKGEINAARREAEQALRLDGDSLANREIIGYLLALTGEWDRGVALMRDALARNPYCHPCVSFGLWADNMRRGDFAAAYELALEYRDAHFFWRELMLTSCLGHLGRLDEARAAAAELLRAKPQFRLRGRRLIAHYIKSDELRATIVDGLHKAGIDGA